MSLSVYKLQLVNNKTDRTFNFKAQGGMYIRRRQNFRDFWPPLPPSSTFYVLFVCKIGQFFDPPPPLTADVDTEGGGYAGLYAGVALLILVVVTGVPL